MKKAFKKIMTMALVLCLVFSFTVKPKKAEAFGAELTIGGWLATGGTAAALGPVLVGLAGALAIGATVKNWETIETYGEKVWDDLTARGVDPETLVDKENYSVTMSPDLVNASAIQADAMSGSTTITNTGWNYMGQSIKSGSGYPNYSAIDPVTIAAGQTLTLYVVGSQAAEYVDNANRYLTVYFSDGSQTQLQTYNGGFSGAVSKFTTSSTMQGKTITGIKAMYFVLNTTNYYYNVQYDAFSVHYGVVSADLPAVPTSLVSYDETFGMVADNAYQRELYANSVLSQNQVMDFTASQDLTNATLETISSATTGTYDETKTQTGILSQMWQSIKGLPAGMAAAATAINTKSQELWEDAGAIWTGMSDTMTGVRADINAKIGALSDATVSGIDNVRTDIGAMMDRLSAGIDSVATSAAANMAAWGQLTLDGIDAGVGTITNGLTSIWERVGAIPAAIDTAATTTAETITGTFVLSEPQKLENEQNMTATRALLLQKFDWITTPIEDIKGLYGQRKSLYDVTFTVLGQEVHVLPIEYQGVISGFRPVVSGAAIMSTIIFIYRRIQPKEVV